MATAFENIDQQITAKLRAAERRYNEHVIDVARGRCSVADLNVALAAGRSVEQFKTDLAHQVEEWEITNRIQQLEGELETRVRPLPDEAVEGPNGLRPVGQNFHGHVPEDSQAKFDNFLRKREEHESRKPQLRSEIAVLRSQLAELRKATGD